MTEMMTLQVACGIALVVSVCAAVMMGLRVERLLRRVDSVLSEYARRLGDAQPGPGAGQVEVPINVTKAKVFIPPRDHAEKLFQKAADSGMTRGQFPAVPELGSEKIDPSRIRMVR